MEQLYNVVLKEGPNLSFFHDIIGLYWNIFTGDY